MIGKTLSHFRILAKLGEGGMGIVYRAEDEKLRRPVALKVLPPEVVGDEERRLRFLREARAAAAVSHPNIATIYEVGEAEGLVFIAMELIEGETLRARIGGRAMPGKEALRLAIEIAEGLAKAHQARVIHRDLKPDNIVLTSEGHAKILDFGLAKLTQPEGSGENLTSLPTSPVQTSAGLLMGTAGYMSPEQVRGRPTDHRSDLFSFGAIFYEMLTGTRAFRRESAVETMNAILKDDPLELSGTGPRLPPGLERIVRHCLEKNPEERFQSARDLAFDLQAITRSSEAVAPAASAGIRLRALPLGWLSTIALVAAGVGLAAYVAGSRSSLRGTFFPEFQTLTFRRGTIYSARFTPDGQSVIYGAAWEGKPSEMFLTRPESPESRSLGLTSAEPLAVSVTGEMAVLLRRHLILGWQGAGTLARMPLAGGAPRELAENVGSADWSPDGRELLVVRYEGDRCRLEYPQGKGLVETGGWISHPRISPDGRRIAYLDHPLHGDDRGVVVVMDSDGKDRKVLTRTWSSTQGLAWSADGGEIWFTAASVGSRTLRAVTLSGHLRTIEPLPGHMMVHDVFKDGKMLLTTDLLRRGIIASPPGETRERDVSWLDWSSPSDLSDDGRLLLFDEQGAGSGNDYYAMYLRGTDGSPAVRIGEGLSRGISPDGKWILTVQEKPSRHLSIFPVGAGEAKDLQGTEIAEEYGLAWFRDGHHIAFSGKELGKQVRVYLLDLQGGPPRPITPEGRLSPSIAVSPDGKWVALEDPDGGTRLYRVEGAEPRVYAAPPGAIRREAPVKFTADGKGLFVTQLGGNPGRIYLLNLATGRREIWKEFTAPDNTGILDYDVSLVTPDGQAYAYSYRQMISTLFLVSASEKPRD